MNNFHQLKGESSVVAALANKCDKTSQQVEGRCNIKFNKLLDVLEEKFKEKQYNLLSCSHK